MKERLRVELLLAAVLVVYCNSLWNGFTFYDERNISSNTQVTALTLRGLFSPQHSAWVFRPLTFATYALQWSLHGARPLGYHLVNLLLHAAVVVLLYLLLRAALETLAQGTNIAFGAALLFAVHPIHVEAVTSISGRPELLAAAFLLAACLLHVRDRELPALACFVLAVLSKESAVVFLPLALVIDCARGQWKSGARYGRMAVATLLYLGALWTVHGGRFGPVAISSMDNPLAALSVRWRVLNALRVAWKYAALLVYPRWLSSDYSFNQIPVYMDWRHTLPAAAGACAVLAAWIWAIRKRKPGLVLAGGIYLCGFAVTANIFLPINTVMGERLAYLPSAGFCLLVALAWAWLWEGSEQNNRREAQAFAALAVVAIIFGVRTMARNADWRDDLTLISSAVRAAPRSAKMHVNLGSQYSADGRFDLARRELQAALDIALEYPDALEAYGLLDSRMGHFEEARPKMEKALSSTPKGSDNYDFMAVNLAVLDMQTDRLDDALKILDQEIADSPKYSRAWANRAVIHLVNKDSAAARVDAETALRLEPGNLQAINVMRRLIAAASATSSK